MVGGVPPPRCTGTMSREGFVFQVKLFFLCVVCVHESPVILQNFLFKGDVNTEAKVHLHQLSLSLPLFFLFPNLGYHPTQFFLFYELKVCKLIVFFFFFFFFFFFLLSF